MPFGAAPFTVLALRNSPAGERAAHGFAARVCHLHPKSRGTLRLRTADPSDAPAIDPRFLSEEADLVSIQSGVERMCESLEQQPLKQLVKRNMDIAAFAGQAALIKWIRARAETVYHPVGTCRMGIDESAVVDSELRVKVLDGLRVSDAS